MVRSSMLLLSVLCAVALTATAQMMGGDSPSMSMGGDSPSMSMGGDSPSMSMGGDSPSMSMGGDSPSMSMGGGSPSMSMGNVSTDVAVMQFALNLEYLEANFYSCAAFGVPLNASLSGGGPAPLGCKKAKLSSTAQYYAASTAEDEIKHVALLRAALGEYAFPQPLLDIGMAFEVAANAALSTTLSPPFSAYGSDVLFYHAAFIFEDVGVTAYAGALPLISDGLLPTAAGIMAVEAYHGGSVRTLLLAVQDQTVFPFGAKVKNIVAAISALRGAVGGGKDARLVTSHRGYIIAPTDKHAVAYSRTTSEVLAIVYLGGKTKGGFFPNGLNGTITM